MATRASHICSSLLLACAMGRADAAELGDAQLRSWIGQPLAASVELTMVEDAAAQVGVRLAHPDVYRGANIAMPAVLSDLSLGVTRQGGRQFLHLSTVKPVESRHLHVYLELSDGGRRSVRLVTLWLEPDPNPAPAVPVPAPAPAPATLSPVARPAAALNEGEEYVEEGPRRVPAPPRKPAAKTAAKPATAPVRLAPPRKAPPAAPASAPDAPIACAAQPAAEPSACVVLGEKNAALRQELGQLEAKVKVLQQAAGVPAPAPAPARAAPAAAPAAAPPQAAPRILKPKQAPPPPEPATPWTLIGGALAAVLALAGLALAWLRRRRSGFGKIPKEHKPARVPKAARSAGAGAADAEARPSFMAAVKARLMPGARKPAAPAPVEPAMENAEN